MLDAANPSSAPRNPDLHPGLSLPMTSLTPSFDSANHQLYLDLLERAIARPSSRNVALTGPYGSGKSSVLEQLRAAHPDRVVELSLSTIAPELVDAGEKSSPRNRYNEIQKEIVKQLLYRLPPSTVPKSRFRRASVPTNFVDLMKAMTFGGTFFLIAYMLGFVDEATDRVPVIDNPFKVVLAQLLIAAATVASSWIAVCVLRARPQVDAALRTGPATVTLSRTSNYFDEYLDEIVYFFEASKRDLVLIEDIDRFDDARVFDTLRALNNLLNESGQIGRQIVFVYAIRDSVFEAIGDSYANERSTGLNADRADATVAGAARTKFFDAIIPIVPFVSADNARDLMSKVMQSDAFTIDPSLIRVAARHVADMRLLHNLRNEFEVYRSRLVAPIDSIPGINDNLVFAIVLFKNTHLSDFESIRNRRSSLDTLYRVWRELVRQNLRRETKALSELRSEQRTARMRDHNAAQLADRLDDLIAAITAAAQAATSRASVESIGPVTTENRADPDAWDEITAGTPQRIVVRNSGTGQSTEFAFDAEQLARNFGISVNLGDRRRAEVLAGQIARSEERIKFLRHHTWEELVMREEFRIDLRDISVREGLPMAAEDVTFRQLVDASLTSTLARELVSRGFLDSHFALYGSVFYGSHVSREALEYISRCIEPGIPDPSFTLSALDVQQILIEQGADKADEADLFSDPSILNTNIVDYLLAHRPGAASTVANQLSRSESAVTTFLDTYMAEGATPSALLEHLARKWPETINYVATTPSIADDVRVSRLDVVLRHLTGIAAVPGPTAAALIESSYASISAVTNPKTRSAARDVMELLRRGAIQLRSLRPLSRTALPEAVRLRLFPLTARNLRILQPEGRIGLDSLRSQQDLYSYVRDDLDTFLMLVKNRGQNVVPVADVTNFLSVLEHLGAETSEDQFDRLVAATPASFRVESLTSTPRPAWPALVGHHRCPPTYGNVTSYIASFGIDENLGRMLSRRRSITEADGAEITDRAALAMDLINATASIPSPAVRAALARSLTPGELTVADIEPSPDDLISRLLRAHLLPDSEAIFDQRLMVNWSTLEATIAASKQFKAIVSPRVLPAGQVAAAIRSAAIGIETKTAIVNALPGLLTHADRGDIRAICKVLIDMKWRLPSRHILGLVQAGATRDSLIQIIAQSADKIDFENLRELLQELGGDWGRVASGGIRQRPSFSATESNRSVLQRFLGTTVRRIEEKAFKSGTKIVAVLR